jgi:hypothetical protein
MAAFSGEGAFGGFGWAVTFANRPAHQIGELQRNNSAKRSTNVLARALAAIGAEAIRQD